MTLPRIIGIAGNSRHGKDTCADYLAARYGYSKYALADPLKSAAALLFGWTYADMEGASKDTVDPLFGLSPRQALQTLGTEFGQYTLMRLYPDFARTTGRTLWVRRLLDRSSDEPLVVVSDVRFPHEAEALRAEGAVVVLVTRPSVAVDTRHESERAVLDVRPDYIVENAGTIEELQRRIDGVMHTIMGVEL